MVAVVVAVVVVVPYPAKKQIFFLRLATWREKREEGRGLVGGRGLRTEEGGVCREGAEGRVLHVSRPPDRIGKMEIIRVASWGVAWRAARTAEGVAAGCRGAARGVVVVAGRVGGMGTE